MDKKTAASGEEEPNGFDLDAFLRDNHFLSDNDDDAVIRGNTLETDWVWQTDSQPVTESAEKLPVVPVSKAPKKPAAKSAAKPATEPAAKPAAKPATKPAAKPVEESTAATIDEVEAQTKSPQKKTSTATKKKPSAGAVAANKARTNLTANDRALADDSALKNDVAQKDKVSDASGAQETRSSASSKPGSPQKKKRASAKELVDEIAQDVTLETAKELVDEIAQVAHLEVAQAARPIEDHAAVSPEEAKTKSTTRTRRKKPQDDPNATMSYAALGEGFPKADIVFDADNKSKKKGSSKAEVSAQAVDSTQASNSTQAVDSTQAPEADDSPMQSWTALSSKDYHRKNIDRFSATRGAKQLKTLADTETYTQTRLNDSDYSIRGGGGRRNKFSPVMISLMAVVVFAGLMLAGYFFLQIFKNISAEKITVELVTLTPSETRQAIDSQMPPMIAVLFASVNDTYETFTDKGWNVVLTDRAPSENKDPTAKGREIIRLEPQVSPDVLQAFYLSEFNGYNFDELQESFNGAWMLSVSHGDTGAYSQLKYVNLAATSLADELAHLRAIQGLNTADSFVDAEGLDGYGNSYVCGYTIDNGTVYYWKVVGVALKGYYKGQDNRIRSLPDTAIFVRCIIASFDFFGLSQPLPSQPTDNKPQPAEDPINDDENDELDDADDADDADDTQSDEWDDSWDTN